MSDKVAIITGGGSGIGKSSALALANADYAVAVAGRRPEPLDETVATIEQCLLTVDLNTRKAVAVPDFLYKALD